MIITNIKLGGLTCIACKKVSQNRISSIPGVKNVDVDQQTGNTKIVSENEITINQIKEVLKDTPYKIYENS